VTMNASGRFAIAWQWNGNHVRAYDAAGQANGVPLVVGQGPASAAVAMDAGGNITIANYARSFHPNIGTVAFDNAAEIQVRRLSVSGVLSETQIVNTTTEGTQMFPALAATPNGFVVSWSGRGAGDDQGVFTQRFTTDVPPQTMTAAAYDEAVAAYLLSLSGDVKK
jgi:hypothetical protein